MINTIISSALDKNSKAKLVETILVDNLVHHYKKQLGIDVSKYFNGVDEIGIYECIQTKYRFYFPFTVLGDSDFYQQLQKFDWYYMPWKWEHKKFSKHLKGYEKILEIGSGGFGFVDKMTDLGFDITGIEINDDSVTKAKNKGLVAFNQTVQDYAKFNKEVYDIVCSFQVLEHIVDVHSFIQAQIDCLKIGGKLVIAVPNNDSFIRYTKNFILNGPPHHMGLWNKKSLISLTRLFNLKLERVSYEPLQKYHINSYVDLMEQEKVANSKLMRNILRIIPFRKFFTYLVSKSANRIRGHSMLVVYVKV